MKMKIRGLVFTGFAAAVFASSAQAVTPPSVTYTVPYDSEEEAAVDALKSTVTSKYYTNETFQTRTSVGAGETANTPKVGVGEGQWAPFEAAPDPTDTNRNGYLYINPQRTANGTIQIDISNGKVATAATEIIGRNDNGSGLGPDTTHANDLTTAQAVYGLLDREGTGAATDTTTIGSSSSDDVVPSSKNVYDFVTQQMSDGNFQRKLNDEDPKAHAYVGVYINQGTTNDPDWQSEWYQYMGGVTTDPNNVNDTINDIYLGVTQISDYNDSGEGAVVVSLARDKLTTTAAQVAAATALNGDLTDLVTVSALKEFVEEQPGNAEIPNECKAPGVHCALVSTYYPNAVGTEGQAGYHAAGSVSTEWTVMAPDDGN